jgi:hypothetical protein
MDDRYMLATKLLRAGQQVKVRSPFMGEFYGARYMGFDERKGTAVVESRRTGLRFNVLVDAIEHVEEAGI